MAWLQKHTQRLRNAQMFAHMQQRAWTLSLPWFPQSLGGLRDTASKYSRIPLQGGLDIRSSPLLSVLPGKWQWVKLWWGGSGGEEAIDWRAFVEMEEYLHLPLRPHRQTEYNTHRNIIYPTHTHIHTHTAEGAAQMGSSVTNDYPPATLTRRDWSHTNASVALSDGWGQKLEWSTTHCLWEVIIRCESCLVRS